MSSAPILVGGRTTHRTINGERGLEPLVAALALGEPRVIGRIGDDAGDRYEEDLRRGRATLEEAGEAVRAAIARGERPVVVASDCSICVSTLPAAAAVVDELHVLWLDAHGDFNTPETSASGFLGGMCLAAACGRWDSGFPGTVEAERVVMCGLRDVDAGERVELDRARVRADSPGAVAELLRGRRAFVHLDLDVLDPAVMPAAVPAPDGLSWEELGTVLADVAEAADVVGLEIAAFEAPADAGEREALARRIAEVVRPLL